MKRLYFLMPNIEIAKRVVDDLLLARIEERNIHVLAKQGTPLENLPEASLLQKSDFLPAMQQGVALGGLTGAFAGLVAIALPTGLVLGGGAVMLLSLAGAGVGAWASSMIGTSVDNRQIQQFEEAIQQGELLIMVDVPKARAEEIEERIREHHPDVEFEGTEPTIPPFP